MVSPALIGNLVNSQPQLENTQVDVLGSINAGQKLSLNNLNLQKARAQIQAYQDEKRRQADIARILAVTPPEGREGALFQVGMPREAVSLGNLNQRRSEAQTAAEIRAAEEAAALEATNQRNAFIQSLPPEQQPLARAYPEKFGAEAAKNAFAQGEVKPPQTRTLNVGDKTVTQQWNAVTGQFETIAEAPRWAPARPGTTIFDPNTGNPIAQIGGGSSTPFSKTTGNKVQEAAFNASNAKARLDDIESRYDSRFLEAGTKLWAAKEDLLDKFNLGTANPDEQEFLDKMYSFYSDAFNHLNTTLKEFSGGAVTPQEAERQLNDIPNPGELTMTAMLSGDGPRKFESKLKRNILRQRRALARYSYYVNTGKISDFNEMLKNNTLPSLEGLPGKSGVDKLMQTRGESLEEMYREQRPNATEDEVFTWVSERLKQEFGL